MARKLAAWILAGLAIVVIIIAFALASMNTKSATPLNETPKPTVTPVDERCIDVLPNQVLVARGLTFQQPFLVELSWNPYEMISSNGTADIQVTMWDNRTSEPLREVTYDFEYKGALDLGSFEDRYVGNFSKQPDRIQIPLRFPCDVYISMRVDKVGEHTFLRTDPEEIKQYGDHSPVLVQFRVFVEEGASQLSMNLFNGRDLSGRTVPAE